MGKSTQLRLTGGKEPRQYMWEAVRESRAGFTPQMIADKSGQTIGSVKVYIKALGLAALIEVVDQTGPVTEHRWRLVRDEGVEFPRVNARGQRSNHGKGLENLWRTLRIMGEMTAADAAEMASVGDVKVTQAYASNYFSILAKAGYLLASEYDFQKAVTYRLAPNGYTGPRHPIVQRDESLQVYDPNKNKVVYSRTQVGGVPADSSPDNDMQEENSRLRKLVAEFVSAGANGATLDLIQRAQLELA